MNESVVGGFNPLDFDYFQLPIWEEERIFKIGGDAMVYCAKKQYEKSGQLCVASEFRKELCLEEALTND